MSESSRHQRLLHICPSPEVADLLSSVGFESAHHIAAIPEWKFVEQYGSVLAPYDTRGGGEILARSVHRQAASTVEYVRLQAMALMTLANPALAAMPATNFDGQLDFYNSLPSYNDLFGSLNYVQCEECQSLWSPAAYFVDLLRLADCYITQPKDKQLSLSARRPDLWQIPLTCESTNQEMPYLQIVNQILEAQVKARMAKARVATNQPAGGARYVLNFKGNSRVQISGNPLQVPNFENYPTIAHSAPNQLTMCAWVNPTTLNPQGLAGIAGLYSSEFPDQTLPSLSMDTDNSLVAALQAASPSGPFTHTVSDFFTEASAWVHIAWVFDIKSNQSTIYRNGIMVSTQPAGITAISSPPATPSSLTYFHIASSTATYWPGYVANLGLWVRALSAKEIQEVMKAEGLPESQSDMASYWLMNDNSATLVNSAPYPISIESTQSLNGSIQGQPAAWSTLSATAADSFLSANPVFSEQPLLYMATQDYPFKLPFNHPLAQIRRLLNHFGFTLADLYAAFQIDAKGDQAPSIAREMLELSPEKYNLLTTAITEATSLQQAYGLIDSGANLSQLSDAGTFLQQTGLNDTQLNELLFQNLRRKRALEFNGYLEVSIGNPPALQALTNDLTVELWMRPTDFTNRVNPLCKAYAGEFALTQYDSKDTNCSPTSSNLYFMYGVTGLSANSNNEGKLYQNFTIDFNTLTLNEWAHVAIVRNLSSEPQTLNAYVNGQPAGSAKPTFPVAVAGTLPVLIGNGYYGGYVGQIADVRLWTVARTEEEINETMNLRLAGDEAGLAGCWPLDDGVGTTVRDISPNENYGTVKATSGNLTEPPAWPMAANLAWDSNEINAEILCQFFINQGLQTGQYLAIQTNPKGPVPRSIVVIDQAGGTVTPLTDVGTFDRLNRFIRLAQALEWSFADLDLALRSIIAPPKTAIDEQAIQDLAAIKKLQARLGLKIDEICALWSDMNTLGIGNDADPVDLFDRTFNYPQSFANTTGVPGTPPYRPQYPAGTLNANPLYTDTPLSWSPTDRTDSEAIATRSRLRAALRLVDDDLTQIAELIAQGKGGISLTVTNLSQFYRCATLARALKLPVSELLTLLRLVPIDDTKPVKYVLTLVAWAEWMKSANLNTAQLEYLTTGKPNRWIDRGYDPNAVPSLLQSMFQEAQSLLLTTESFVTSGIGQNQAQQIFQTLQTDGDVDANGVVLKQPVVAGLGPEPLSRSILELDGSGYITIPKDPFIGPDGKPFPAFTICAWVNAAVTDPTNDSAVCGMDDGGTVNQAKPTMYLNEGDANELAFLVGGFDKDNNPTSFSTYVTGLFPAPGGWVHLGWVFDPVAGTSSVYRNGKLFQPPDTTTVAKIYTSTSDYNIGAYGGGSKWQGEIANFGIWQRPLDEREIQSVMHATGVPKDNIGLGAYWLIDDDSTTIKDSIGSNNGSITGTGNWVAGRDLLAQSGSSNLTDLLVREVLTVALARQDAYVTQKLAAFFKVSPALMAATQAVAVAVTTKTQPWFHINRLLIDLSAGDSVPDQVNGLFAELALDLYLANALKLPASVMAQIALQPEAFKLSNLGASFKWTLADLRTFTAYRKLLVSCNTTSETFAEYFYLAAKTAAGFAAAAQSKLSEITDWPVDQVALLEGQTFWSNKQFDTVEQVAALKECFDLAARLGAGIDLLLTLRSLNSLQLGAPGATPEINNWQSYQDIAHNLNQTIGAEYGNSIAPQVMSTIQGKLEELKRDVLAAFLLWQLSFVYEGITTTDDLYDFLLIDVDMSSVVQISPLKAGLNSLQLYVETTQMNLEAEVTNQIPRLWWKWMSNYRVWQANREVFVYPENYIDPALRRFPTPEFKQLEANLQQGNLNPELVEKALNGYLEGLAGLANLEIVASYRAPVGGPVLPDGTEQKVDTLFLFGRTRTNPPTYYFRTLRLFGKVEMGVWTPWQQINVSINAALVTPVYAFEKLFLFWVEQSFQTINLKGNGQDGYQVTNATIYFTCQKLDRNWMQPQVLEQNLPISIIPPANNNDGNNYPTINTNEPAWWTVQLFLDPDSGQLIVLYGELFNNPPAQLDAPTPVGNAEIDAYNRMIYESRLFAEPLEVSGFLTSYIPVWILGDTMGRDRASLKINFVATNYCTGVLNSNDQLMYSNLSFVPPLDAKGKAESPDMPVVPKPQNFLPLNGNLNDEITGGQATANGTPVWTTDPTCPLGPNRLVLDGVSTETPLITESISEISGSLSVELWLEITPGQTDVIINISGSSGPGYQLWLYNDTIWAANSGAATDAGFPEQTGWMCISFVVDADAKAISIYLNGQHQATETSNITISTVSTLHVEDLSGKIANVSVWNQALTDEEIRFNASCPLLSGLSAAAARVQPTLNQPGWFTFDNGDEAFLATPLIPGASKDKDNPDVFSRLDQIISVSPTPAKGAGHGVNRRSVTVGFGDAAVNPTAFAFGDLQLKFTRITTHTVANLQRRCLTGGPDKLLSLISQVSPELPFSRFTPTAQVLAPEMEVLDFNGAYGEYFWELFFYIPFLIANTYSTTQRYQLTQKWLQYIFDPTPMQSDWIAEYRAKMSALGLVSYWSLDGHTADLMGINPGTLDLHQSPSFETVTFVNEATRQVFNSPGTSDNTVKINGPTLNITKAITLEGWCNLSSAGGDDSWLITRKVDGEFVDPWYVYRLSIQKGTLFTFSLAINGVDVILTSSSPTVQTGTWYYVVGTFDGQDLRLYVNGEQVASRSLADLTPPPPRPWTIDSSSQEVVLAGDTMFGFNANMGIWKTALSPEAIKARYQAAFTINPETILVDLQSKVTVQNRFWRFRPFLKDQSDSISKNLQNQQQIAVYNYDPFDPNALARLRIGANERGIVMRYVENLITWGNKLFAQYTWETITEASMFYTEALDLLGPAPRQVGDVPAPPVKTAFDLVQEYGSAAKIPQFLIELENITFNPPVGQQLPALPLNLLNSYFCVPMNKALLALWQVADSQLYKIRHGENIKGQPQPLPLFEPPLNPAALVKAGGTASVTASGSQSGSATTPYYRFSYLITQAKDLTSQVMQLGSNLLGALERQDAEQLALMQNSDEGAILNLTTQIKQDQIDQLEQTTQSLQAALAGAQERQQTYASWLNSKGGEASWAAGLSESEVASLGLLTIAGEFHAAGALMRAIASPVFLFPTIFGLADGGMNFGGSLDAVAGSFDSAGGVVSIASQLAGMVAQFQRRNQEWELQYQLAIDDVAQIQAQIEANQSALSGAQQDLKINQEQIAQNQAIGNFYKSKFTNEQLYQWMAGRLSSLYEQSYQLAFALAQEAQLAFQYEQNSQKNYLNYNAWDSLEKGLTAGDSLMFSLSQLEKANIDAGVRHLEIEKTISLLQIDSQAVLDLKQTGKCSFSLTEQLFDYDFPGQYNRKIATVAITIPAIVGPYQNIHAILTQTSNRVVLQPDKAAVEYLMPGGDQSGGPPLTIRSNWNINQQVALSRGSNDSGLFELNFSDPRYLPFEGTGAISSWTLEMPRAANAIDFNSISDVVIQMRYTAQDGGLSFYNEVTSLVQTFFGIRFLSLRQTFPEAWHNFLNPVSGQPTLKFPILRAMFPLNLTPESVTLGTPASSKTQLPGTIGVQMLWAEGAKPSSFSLMTLNNAAISKNEVVLTVPPSPASDTSEPVKLSSFGPSVRNELDTTGTLPENKAAITDVILIIPFSGTLNWP